MLAFSIINKNSTKDNPLSYEMLLDWVAEFEKEALSASSQKVAQEIYSKASREQNGPQACMALLRKMEFESAIDSENQIQVLAQIEEHTAETTDIIEKSVLHSLTARIYANYYLSKQYEIDQRTNIDDIIPKDIREWSSNMFTNKIIREIESSLHAKDLLANASTKEYEMIIDKGESSAEMQLSLLDFLAHESIETLSSIEASKQYSGTQSEISAIQNLKISIYQQLLQFRSEIDNIPALVNISLERLQYTYEISKDQDRRDIYLSALGEMEGKYENNEICVEIYNQQAKIYLEQEDKKEAYQICIKGIERFPDYKRINILHATIASITQPAANVESKSAVYPGKSLELRFSYTNIDSLRLEIYRIENVLMKSKSGWGRDTYFEEYGSLVSSETIKLINLFPYLDQDSCIKLQILPLGNYEYVFRHISRGNLTEDTTAMDPLATGSFSVSRLATQSRGYTKEIEILVVDRMTGKPIKGALVDFYETNYIAGQKRIQEIQSSVKSDKYGLAKYMPTEKRVDFYRLSYKDDKPLILSSAPWLSGARMTEKTQQSIQLLTDRGIYRPGQIVYVKGIASKKDNGQEIVAAEIALTLVLRDANNTELQRQQLQTNDFGSFYCDFILPPSSMNGIFTIAIEGENSLCRIRVEEYKRPKFYISLLPIEGTYTFGDKLNVRGEAGSFSGINLQHSSIKYRIFKQSPWYWRAWRAPQREIAQGEVKTDEKGQFEISFIPEKGIGNDKYRTNLHSYMLQVSITDASGETQQEDKYIRVDSSAFALEIKDIDQRIDKNAHNTILIKTNNLDDNPVEVSGDYEIYRLQTPSLLEEGAPTKDLKTSERVFAAPFVGNKELELASLTKLPSGMYRFIGTGTDSKGRAASTSKDFILYDQKDKKPPVPLYFWMLPLKTEVPVGGDAEIVFGSSAKGAYILCEIFKGYERLSIQRFVLSNKCKLLKIPYEKSYGDQVGVMFSMVKDEKIFSKKTVILRALPPEKLYLNLDVFRDRLMPGQKEEWTLSVKDQDNKAVDAEVLASMYDFSLDAISPFDFRFGRIAKAYMPSPYAVGGKEFATQDAFIHYPYKDYIEKLLLFDRFNLFGPKGVYTESFKFAAANGRAPELAAMEGSVSDNATVVAPALAKGSDTTSPQIRRNFNETAFFYPQLRTNALGETLISFVVPESNTTWKFQALAHTKDMKYGQIEAKAISQKKLMLAPNIPRFVRQGDKTSLVTNIYNLSDQLMEGKVSLSFADPATGNSIAMPEFVNASQSFSIEAGSTTTAEWRFDIPESIDLLTCKLVAQTEGFSDGEQHMIPILPRRILITESLPLFVSGRQTKEFPLNYLFKNESLTTIPYKLSLEYASNPTWYAVQALPKISAPQSNNAIDWFAAYYANVLASSIANTTPRLKEIVEAWTQQGGTKQDLVSNLEKNQELKVVLLEETPWLMEAKNETEQQQSLALLFDTNRSAMLGQQSLDKLRELQNPDGGWSWFKGMPSSQSITQWILYGMAHLVELQAISYPQDVREMQMSALAFIDRRFADNFLVFKEQMPQWKSTKQVSTPIFEYLFVRSYYQDIPLGEAREARQFYHQLAQQYWAEVMIRNASTKNPQLYTAAINAMLMQRSGERETAQKIIKSLGEHATRSNEMGMYWANNQASPFMFQDAVCTHTIIMQAFEEVGCSEQDMNQMKQWLLFQKQTQAWGNTPATVNAVYALLKAGSTNWLASEGGVDIELGKTKINSQSRAAGTGYFKQVLDAKTIGHSIDKLNITSQSDAPIWGALYWQYYQDVDKVSGSKTGLLVDKAIFIEGTGDKSKVLQAPSASNPIRVGDKIVVRLTVRSNRDLQYVALKDMHSACMEPTEQLSGYKWRQSVGYYQTSKDASTSFYFENLPRGAYVFEYSLFASRAGEYSAGITSVQCLYAPQYSANSEGRRVVVH